MQAIGPCPDLNGPKHGDSATCTRRHVRPGFVNAGAFYTWLPAMRAADDKDPEPQAARKLDGSFVTQLQADGKPMEEQGLIREGQER